MPDAPPPPAAAEPEGFRGGLARPFELAGGALVTVTAVLPLVGGEVFVAPDTLFALSLLIVSWLVDRHRSVSALLLLGGETSLLSALLLFALTGCHPARFGIAASTLALAGLGLLVLWFRRVRPRLHELAGEVLWLAPLLAILEATLGSSHATDRCLAPRVLMWECGGLVVLAVGMALVRPGRGGRGLSSQGRARWEWPPLSGQRSTPPRGSPRSLDRWLP